MALLLTALACFARSPCSVQPVPFFDTGGRLARGEAPVPDGSKLYVPVHAGKSLVRPCGAGGYEPVVLPAAQASELLAQGGEHIEAWLGRAEGGALEALAQNDAEAGFWLLDLAKAPAAGELAEGAEWLPLRDRAGPSVCDDLVEDDYAALLAMARGLSVWHRSMGFCSFCGGKTEPIRNGRQRKCTDCGARHRPRLDPSVIVLVVKGDKCLLGRKASWPAGRYSTLAGFVEFGESLEECIVREMKEESGVSVDRGSIRFVASQPWLFPRSLMCGFIVSAEDSGSVVVEEEELEDAAWFSAEQVRTSLEENAGEGSFHVPSRVSLARTLVETWLSEQR